VRVLLASCALVMTGLAVLPSDAPAVPRAAPHRRATVAAPTPSAPAPVVPSPSPSPSQPPPLVQRGTGRLTVVPGRGPRTGRGQLRTYEVLVEGGLHVDGQAFAAAVQQVLADPRSWTAGGRYALQRVDSGGDLRVVLASPYTTDRLCAPLTTEGRLSCGSGHTAVLNLSRWFTGAPAYAGHLDQYRDYLVNHEVGHVLGRRHARCPGPGRLAPVMMQQTLGVGACRPSPWPFP
jgi:hypothetical protein